ncbi:hypothetical protein Mal15_60820 [Stieleria maiorica]|uniref:Uncharacterized protein n=1 Tax=Stieleria maiorica TaxID=2795974 RepID=A0A5B9ML54_9BACT|nr:hypothetical protein Mal15_60820 [Stieleria maiorica]
MVVDGGGRDAEPEPYRPPISKRPSLRRRPAADARSRRSPRTSAKSARRSIGATARSSGGGHPTSPLWRLLVDPRNRSPRHRRSASRPSWRRSRRRPAPRRRSVPGRGSCCGRSSKASRERLLRRDRRRTVRALWRPRKKCLASRRRRPRTGNHTAAPIHRRSARRPGPAVSNLPRHRPARGPTKTPRSKVRRENGSNSFAHCSFSEQTDASDRRRSSAFFTLPGSIGVSTNSGARISLCMNSRSHRDHSANGRSHP